MAEGYEPQPWDGKPLKAITLTTSVSCATVGGSTYHGSVSIENQITNNIGNNAYIVAIIPQSALGNDPNYGPTNVYYHNNKIYAESEHNLTYDVKYAVFYK